MSFLTTLTTAYRVGRDVGGAWDAAAHVLEAGGSPLAAVRAFAAASDNQLDDQAVAVLEDALRRAIAGCTVAVDVAATVATFLDAHRGEIVAAVEGGVGLAIDVGYRAIGWRETLRAWAAEPTLVSAAPPRAPTLRSSPSTPRP